jgi:chaperone BCS1
MSTNHPERLDPALVRPGRVDVRMEFPNADRGQARQLFVRSFGPGASVGRPAEEFAVAIGDGRWPMAPIRGLLLERSDDPEMAVRVAGGDARANTRELAAATGVGR